MRGRKHNISQFCIFLIHFCFTFSHSHIFPPPSLIFLWGNNSLVHILCQSISVKVKTLCWGQCLNDSWWIGWWWGRRAGKHCDYQSTSRMRSFPFGCFLPNLWELSLLYVGICNWDTCFHLISSSEVHSTICSPSSYNHKGSSLTFFF